MGTLLSFILDRKRRVVWSRSLFVGLNLSPVSKKNQILQIISGMNVEHECRIWIQFHAHNEFFQQKAPKLTCSTLLFDVGIAFFLEMGLRIADRPTSATWLHRYLALISRCIGRTDRAKKWMEGGGTLLPRTLLFSGGIRSLPIKTVISRSYGKSSTKQDVRKLH